MQCYKNMVEKVEICSFIDTMFSEVVLMQTCQNNSAWLGKCKFFIIWLVIQYLMIVSLQSVQGISIIHMESVRPSHQPTHYLVEEEYTVGVPLVSIKVTYPASED